METPKSIEKEKPLEMSPYGVLIAGMAAKGKIDWNVIADVCQQQGDTTAGREALDQGGVFGDSQKYAGEMMRDIAKTVEYMYSRSIKRTERGDVEWEVIFKERGFKI